MKDANTSQLGRHVMVRLGRITHWQAELSASEALLNERDKARSGRFRFPEDKARFVLGRRLLAEGLKEVNMMAGAPLNLALTAQGRPFLPDAEEINFSISHSKEFVGIALTLKCSVGIDLEAISHVSNLQALSEKIFSESDLMAFQKLAKEDYPALFFRAWTAKEAYLKALGLGIAGGLKDVRVPVEAYSPLRIHFHPQAQEGAWVLQHLPLPEDYCGCVVWNDPSKTLDLRVLNPTA